jgi:hypothetical protein
MRGAADGGHLAMSEQCLLYPQKRTSIERSEMPAKCQKQTLRCFTRSPDRRAAARKVERTAQGALTVFEMRVLGHGFVLDYTNDRREYCAASATGNHL